MTQLAPWSNRCRGDGCPFDLPGRDVGHEMIAIRTLSISTLYLSREQTYRGYCIVVFNPRHAIRIDDLTREEWADLSADLWIAQSAVQRAISPDHINLVSLGNRVPHLHWHIIPRYEDDPRWGNAIWTTHTNEMPDTRLEDAEYAQLIAAIDGKIDTAS